MAWSPSFQRCSWGGPCTSAAKIDCLLWPAPGSLVLPWLCFDLYPLHSHPGHDQGCHCGQVNGSWPAGRGTRESGPYTGCLCVNKALKFQNAIWSMHFIVYEQYKNKPFHFLINTFYLTYKLKLILRLWNTQYSTLMGLWSKYEYTKAR